MSMKKLELYVHIPFCEEKCKYCDFLSFKADDGEKKAYVTQLIEEIKAQGQNYSDYLVSSIFIGGGTPTTLNGIWILDIMNAIRENFMVETDAEVSIECNPGTLSTSKIMHIKKAGVNRISFGLQSSIEEELKELGRIHTYKDFLQSYQLAREYGFTNINVDLMSGLPKQTIDSYKTTLKRVCALKPEHISAYSLIIEPGTPFFEKYGSEEGAQLLPGENTDRELYALTKSILKEHGYERYEISNYAKPGRECRHNIGYWTGVSYLGFGVGASGYVMNRRFHVESDYRKYMSVKMQQDITPLYCDIEELDIKANMEEFMFLGLRLTKGVSRHEFNEKFGVDMFEVFDRQIKRNMMLKLMEYNSPYLRLTEKGLDLSNMVMSDFLLD
ncbi:oxygen-independent coproporphyrinogen III oxidase [Lachnoanaerobaculum sp. Marseille-Q4761]|uniref:radical SAM family heme chaperone HemW n=1 Tax=Lachnoanaerobaculum sp. Marseille-Q4761 TaxID=2819511 RepID=UPI001AA0F395|nr:radical SAM family heme chaperone HemW [Lachnoanaerobaculum sp. Marseille-Q4761]MBO1869803.1 oxygen-independent coproporphyrinogen III oxidase [Lachnoanaerobaculum sp. Marseille-Q4761]